MKSQVLELLKRATTCYAIDTATIKVGFPENPDHGDFTTNLALVNAKELKMSPKALADKIVLEIQKIILSDGDSIIESVSVAGPGFINIKIKTGTIMEEVLGVANLQGKYGWLQKEIDNKVMVEFTDPNPFKIFHIGHLMSNAIGESLSRLIESSGANVIRACYQGDVGLHVAKTIWAIMFHDENRLARFKQLSKTGSVIERVTLLGNAYTVGNGAYDMEDLSGALPGSVDKLEVRRQIDLINKKIFEKSDAAINEIYEAGRNWSLEYFDLVYEKLGTKFDKFFFESEVAEKGVEIVKSSNIFEKSDGATVFKGENHGVHTRVFITSNGLPTYEAKELGLNTTKFEMYPDLKESVIVTANEQSDYFKVLLKVFELVDKNVSSKTKHISHGMMRFASGKMSSRKGNIISAEALLGDIREMVLNKIADRDFSAEEKDVVADQVAVSAIKYSILRQSIGSDIIFDSSASINFEGDSGPYLQYAVVRAKSVLEKAIVAGIARGSISNTDVKKVEGDRQATLVERMIVRFPEVLARARKEYAPQEVAGYLISLSSAFNSFYASQVIIDASNPLSPYFVALTTAFVKTMESGLDVLGISVPNKM